MGEVSKGRPGFFRKGMHVKCNFGYRPHIKYMDEMWPYAMVEGYEWDKEWGSYFLKLKGVDRLLWGGDFEKLSDLERRERDNKKSKQWLSTNKKRANEWHREWKKNNKQRLFEKDIKNRYNLTIEQYENLLTEQNGVCKICKKFLSQSNTNRLVIDHCHDTGIVRGLLCYKCNFGIGIFSDNIEYLKSAALYLENFKNIKAQ